jgi:hypothetical protein
MSRDDESEYAPEADEAGELWCPKCGAVMYADASLCRKCDEYVTPGARPSRAMPLWIWVTLIVVLLAMIAGAFFGA